jgi:hypothetical protein
MPHDSANSRQSEAIRSGAAHQSLRLILAMPRGPEGMVRPGGCLYQSRVGPLKLDLRETARAEAAA